MSGDNAIRSESEEPGLVYAFGRPITGFGSCHPSSGVEWVWSANIRVKDAEIDVERDSFDTYLYQVKR
jgi:hypothetical protein